MSFDLSLLRRHSTRLRARDYSTSGNYFVTLCTDERRPLFGDVVDGVMHLNDLGRAVELSWNEIPRHFPHAELDEHIVMPNHVHGIIRIVGDAWRSMLPTVRAVGTPIVPGLWVAGSNGSNAGTDVHVGANNYWPLHPHISPRRQLTRSKSFPMGHGTSRTIGSMVRGFKIGVTRWAGIHVGIEPIWQRNYHDHVIRNHRSLERVRAYIRNNPANWARDRHNPEQRSP
jgi:REP element-mobilizing transposase RayT